MYNLVPSHSIQTDKTHFFFFFWTLDASPILGAFLLFVFLYFKKLSSEWAAPSPQRFNEISFFVRQFLKCQKQTVHGKAGLSVWLVKWRLMLTVISKCFIYWFYLFIYWAEKYSCCFYYISSFTFFLSTTSSPGFLCFSIISQ